MLELLAAAPAHAACPPHASVRRGCDEQGCSKVPASVRQLELLLACGAGCDEPARLQLLVQRHVDVTRVREAVGVAAEPEVVGVELPRLHDDVLVRHQARSVGRQRVEGLKDLQRPPTEVASCQPLLLTSTSGCRTAGGRLGRLLPPAAPRPRRARAWGGRPIADAHAGQPRSLSVDLARAEAGVVSRGPPQ